MSGSHFFEKLQRRVDATKSMLCIGLDPHISQLSDPTADAAAAFCINIIEKTHMYAAAYKPNSAFFEAFGAKGFDALIRVMKVLRSKIHSCDSPSGFRTAVNISFHLPRSSIPYRLFLLTYQSFWITREEILTLLLRRMRHLLSRFSMQVL